MTRKRVVAALMVLVQAAILGHEFKQPGFALLVAALALAGGTGRWRLPLSRRSGFRVYVLLAVGVAVGWVVAAPEPAPAAVLQNGTGYALAQYFLLLQALLLFIDSGELLTRYFAIYGTLVMTCAGDVMASSGDRLAFHAAAIAYVFLMAAFASASRRMKPAAGNRSARVAGAGVLLATLLLAVSVSWLLGTYEEALNTAFNDLVLGAAEMPVLGFSDQAHLGSVGEFQGIAAEATALRVRSRACPGYLRGKSYDRLKGTRWTSSVRSATILPDGESSDGRPLFELREREMTKTPEGEAPAGPARQQTRPPADAIHCPAEVTSLVDTSGVLFTSLPTRALALDAPSVDIYTDGTAKCPDERAPSRYELFPAEASRASWPPPPSGEYRAALLSLPEGIDPRVRALAARLFAGRRTLAGKCSAVVDYFARNYRYHLGLTVPPGQDPLTYFLLERPAAHCEYFASGAVLLLRLGGVPCRYVTGFVAADYNPLAGIWNVRNKDAHAWVEVYDSARGWITVEPTVGGGVPAAPVAGLATTLGHLWEFVQELLRRTGASLHPRTLIAMLAAGSRAAAGHPTATLFMVAVIGMLCRRRLSIRQASRRQKRAAQRAPELERLRRLLRVVDRRVARAGLTRAPNETLHRFALRLETSAAAEADARRAALLRTAAGWYRQYAGTRYQAPIREADVASLAEGLRGSAAAPPPPRA